MQTVKSDEISILDQQITFTARTAASVLKLEIVGSAPTLGSWHLKNAVHLERGEISGTNPAHPPLPTSIQLHITSKFHSHISAAGITKTRRLVYVHIIPLLSSLHSQDSMYRFPNYRAMHPSHKE